MSDYLTRLEERLTAQRITVLQARDGILESYVVTNRKALDSGYRDAAVEGSDDEVYEKLHQIMSDLFSERGADIEKPSVRELRSIRYTLDLKLKFSTLPSEITETHDIVCEILLEKAGELGFDEVVQPGSMEFTDEENFQFKGVLEKVGEPEVEKKEPAWPPAPPTGQPQPEAPMESFSATPSVTVEPEMSPFQASLEAKLKLDQLSPVDARDGIIESLVAANRKSLGDEKARALSRANEGEFEIMIRAMMREFFSSRGGEFVDPTVELLEEAKEFLDNKLNLLSMPEGIRAEHDRICEKLLGKVRLLLHTGGEVPKLKVASFTPSPTPEAVPEIPVTEPVSVSEPESLTEPESLIEPVSSAEPVSSKPGFPSSEKPEISVPETAVPRPAEPEPVPAEREFSIDDIVSRIRAELSGVIKQEVEKALAEGQKPAVSPSPPAGVAASVDGNTVFLAWLDIPDQPSYHVYQLKDSGWVKLTSAPVTRPSFRIELDTEGEFAFAVSAVSASGEESLRSPEVRVKV